MSDIEAAPSSGVKSYIEKQDALIRNTLDAMQCQPVFFIGSGFSKRYFGAPSWIELLRLTSKRIGMSEAEFNYLVQKNKGLAIPIGQDLQEAAFEWAWKKGKTKFPKEYFEAGKDQSQFLKYLACTEITQAMPSKAKLAKLPLANELTLLRTTSPHAIITTNYDSFLEAIFEGYEPIIGERVIRYNLNMVGEIFKIHGTADDVSSIVLTADDYDNYRQKKKYISAKLLTYLAEHPVFVFGYGFGDPNVTEIIEDVGEIIGGKDRFISNIFYVQWAESVSGPEILREEYVVGSGDHQYRVRAIVADDFSWIYKAIAQEREIGGVVNTRVLRAMASRMYKLIRTDIPRRQFEVNYDTLEGVAGSENELPRLLGLVEADNSNLTHPFVLTQVGQQLGFGSWHGARKLICEICVDKGVDITASDNCYHCGVKAGQKTVIHKYSKEAVSLLRKVKAGEAYTLRI